jgi:hypothetical protein
MENSWKNSSDLSGANPANPLGRWPANLILTHAPGCVRVGSRNDTFGGGEQATSGFVSGYAHNGFVGQTVSVPVYECAPGCPAAALDAQSGVSKSTGGRTVTRSGGGNVGSGKASEKAWTNDDPGFGDTGGASRFFTTTEYGDDDLLPGEKPGDPPFFYSPKANRAEREAGCEGLPGRTGAEATDREEGTDGLNSPRAGAGRTAAKVRNHHPCVKPVSVMRWLVRLVTPKNGVVLDPFAGSGTTGVACVHEGFDFIGIEREAEYAAIAEARINHADTTRRRGSP